MPTSAFIRKRLAWLGLPCLLIFILFAISSSMQACGDFELWAEKSESGSDDDDDDDDDRDTPVECDNFFPGLAAFASEYDSTDINTLNSDITIYEPMNITVVPDGIRFTFDDDDDTGTPKITVEEGDLIAVDQGTGSGNGKIVVYTYSASNNSSEYTLLSGLTNPGGIALLDTVILSVYSVDMLFYILDQTKVNVQLPALDLEDIAVANETSSALTDLAVGSSGDTYALFMLDSSLSNKVLRIQKELDLSSIDSLDDITNAFKVWPESTDLLTGISNLKDMVFDAVSGSLYVLSNSGVYEITSAVTRSSGLSSPEALIASSAFSASTPSGIEIVYSAKEASSATLLVMFSGTTSAAQIQQFDADTGEVEETEVFSPLSSGNSLKALAYDCKNGRLIMANSPRSFNSIANGTIYEAPNP